MWGSTFKEVEAKYFHQQVRWHPPIATPLKLDLLQYMPHWYVVALQKLISITKSQKLQRSLLPPQGKNGIYNLPLKGCQKLDKVWRRDKLVFQPNDSLLLPDSYWDTPAIWSVVSAAKSRQVRISVVIYDLIPILQAHLYGAANAKRFRQYLESVISIADILVPISRSVANELIEFTKTSNMKCPRIVPMQLGAEFPTFDQPVRRELINWFTGDEPHFSMIGSIEIRKNHSFALEAMDLLWKTHPTAKFLIAGAAGFRGDEFLTRLRSHPNLDQQLAYFSDLNDAEIDYCYRKSTCVIMASIAEGFGLPIVEALHRGAQVLASDIPVHREVGGICCDYFQLSSTSDLAEKLARIVSHPISAKYSSTDMPYVSWQAAIDQLLEALQ